MTPTGLLSHRLYRMLLHGFSYNKRLSVSVFVVIIVTNFGVGDQWRRGPKGRRSRPVLGEGMGTESPPHQLGNLGSE